MVLTSTRTSLTVALNIHEYNRLHYILEVFNFFGRPCNTSLLEQSDSVGTYQDWGVEPLWQQNENIFIYSAFWIQNQVQAIALHVDRAEPVRNCYLWFEDKEKPVIGKFKYAKIDNDIDNGHMAYFYYCTLVQDHEPYAVSFSSKSKKDFKKILITINLHRDIKINTTICVAPAVFNKRNFVEFLSYHKLVGISDFVFYHNSIPHRLSKIISNLSTSLGIKVHFFPWNYPKNEGSLSRLIVENDCILRTSSVSSTSITLEMNEFIVPAGYSISFADSFNKVDGKRPERIRLPVQTFCVESASIISPIVLQNTEVNYKNDNQVLYIYGGHSEESTVVTHDLGKNVISIHKYVNCSNKPQRVYHDVSMLRFTIDLTRSTLVQLLLHHQL
ncbi:hypothetical protein FQR65_LT03045 [Abscondita terminalis]|nr:hypothetical protein FQR65_LT03045 [Abscondita terminalis]